MDQFLFKHFCKTTSLHGFGYFVNDTKTTRERLLWILALCIVYACCGSLIEINISDWISSPAVLSIENRQTEVDSFPFPAVTVCNSNQIKASVYNISANLALKGKYTEPEGINITFVNEIDYISLICNNELDEELVTEFLDLDTFYRMLNNVHDTCEETYAIIKWMNESYGNPCAFMQPILTDLGVCYSYNMLPYAVLIDDFYLQVLRLFRLTSNYSWTNYTDWTPETDYVKKHTSWNDVPRRTWQVGSRYAYTACVLEEPNHFNPKCKDSTMGFTILVHSPADYPSSLNTVVAVGKTSTQAIEVRPRTIRSSPQIKHWSPQQRGCYYDHERSLRYFKLYTETNCNLECESNFSLAECGCVTFYHPKSLFTPICGGRKMDCIEDSLVTLSELDRNDARKCNCLPSCTTLDYESDVRTVAIIPKPKLNDESSRMKQKRRAVEDEGQNIIAGVFTVYYQSENTLGYIRVPAITFSEFVGKMGGILELFLGFSLFCCLEIVYFLTVRLFKKID